MLIQWDSKCSVRHNARPSHHYDGSGGCPGVGHKTANSDVGVLLSAVRAVNRPHKRRLTKWNRFR